MRSSQASQKLKTSKCVGVFVRIFDAENSLRNWNALVSILFSEWVINSFARVMCSRDDLQQQLTVPWRLWMNFNSCAMKLYLLKHLTDISQLKTDFTQLEKHLNVTVFYVKAIDHRHSSAPAYEWFRVNSKMIEWVDLRIVNGIRIDTGRMTHM